eukprot:5864072-Pyramimonas_sp.AAC.1
MVGIDGVGLIRLDHCMNIQQRDRLHYSQYRCQKHDGRATQPRRMQPRHRTKPRPKWTEQTQPRGTTQRQDPHRRRVQTTGSRRHGRHPLQMDTVKRPPYLGPGKRHIQLLRPVGP